MTTDTCNCAGESSFDGADVVDIAGKLKALGDPIRLRIVNAIATCQCGNTCQCDLASLFDITQPTLSHHLKKLTDVGIISATKSGRACCYQLNHETLKEVRTCLKL